VCAVCSLRTRLPTKGSIDAFSKRLQPRQRLVKHVRRHRAFAQQFPLAAGLEQIQGNQLTEFSRTFDLPDPAPSDPVPSQASAAAGDGQPSPAAGVPSPILPPDLVLVGWSPAALDAPEPQLLETLKRHWDACQRYLDDYLDDLSVWRPTPNDMAGFQFAVDVGHRHDLRRLVVTSSEWSRTPLGWTPPVASLPPADIGAAVKRLVATRRSRDRATAALARAEYAELLERDVLQPLIDRAGEVECPITTGALVLTADLGRLVHPLAAQLARRGVRIVDGKPDPRLHQLLTLTDRYLKLLDKLQTWDSAQKGKLLAWKRNHRSARPAAS
jgi:hypothetical protein